MSRCVSVMAAVGPRRGERGHALAIEAAIIFPALVLFVALVIVLAREEVTQQAVGAAASQAARAASLERSAQVARTAAESAAGSALADAGAPCSQQLISVDASGLRAPLGTPSFVSVTVTCVLEHDLGFPGFPQHRRMSETRTSPVDTHRGR
ncbi:pilus assembly protein [Tessaracoccus sp.]